MSSIALNLPLVNAVKCWNYLVAHVALKVTMRADLYDALKALVATVGPSLKLVENTAAHTDEELEKAEKTLAASREMIMHLHEGAKFRYRKHSDQLTELVPLRLGDDPAEDGVRLHTLARVLPTLQPAYPWLPDDGLTLQALKKQIVDHEPAAKLEAAAGTELKTALKLLRDQRPAALKLWDEEGGGLEAWIVANVPKADQYAAGRERRKRPRHAQPPAPQPKPAPQPQPAPAPANPTADGQQTSPQNAPPTPGPVASGSSASGATTPPAPPADGASAPGSDHRPRS